jgi:hypothetical protein
MTAPSRNRRRLAWAAVLVSTVALVSIVLSYPREVADPVLGAEWKCSQAAFLTSCTRIAPAPAKQSLRTGPHAVPPAVIRA